MNKITLNKWVFNKLTLSLCLIGFSSTSYAELMISQYVDGNNNKKGIELYNPDGGVVDLSAYQLKIFPNGQTTANLTVKLQGTLTAQQHFLIGHSNLKTELGEAVQQTANLSFNGDDAIVLYKNNVAVDRFGAIGTQQNWATGLSFERTKKTHDVVSIDPSAPFEIQKEWAKWSDRNAFNQYLAISTNEPIEPSPTTLSCNSANTPIAELSQAAKNQNYTVKGVITADYRYANGFSGFYIQAPDAKAKPDLTNAIFVYAPASSPIKGGKVGEEVVLKGRLTEYQNQLQIDNLSENILTCNQAASAWITPLSIELPFESLTNTSGHAPKRYQGMLVKIPQTLTVSENYNYGRYGQLSLSLGRLFMPTNIYPAKSAEATALAQKNLLSKIELDDGYNAQNLTPTLPSQFSALNTLRAGDQLNAVEGILEYRFNSWRIQPVRGRTQIQIKANNPRPPMIQKNSNQTRVVAFNVLNYDNGLNGFPTERGASSKAEFEKQHAKIVSAMKEIDADVFGLMEIANNGYGENSAIAYLTRALGSEWKYITPPNSNRLGDDAIAVAIIYNSKRVKPVNAAAVFDDQSQRNRVTLAQSFQPVSGGKIFTVIPNHLKSKGSCPSNDQSADADQGDGQGCWNATRVKAVQQLMQWIAKNPTQITGHTNTLLIGDLNSYAKEDPILALERANYTNVLADKVVGLGEQAYTYVFGVDSNKAGFGGAGNLDHALADASLFPAVKRAFVWHINADEPTNLDYNEEFKTTEQKSLFYADHAFRSSDHDPVIVDLELNSSTISEQPQRDTKSGGGSLNWLSILGLSLLALVGWRRRNHS